jgi:hypothetical protein
VYDSRCPDVFEDPVVIPTVSYVMNNHESAETASSAFDLTFGPEDRLYQSVLGTSEVTITQKFLLNLKKVLHEVRQISRDFQDKLVEERGKDNPKVEEQNRYSKGDLVMHFLGPKPSPKLSSVFKGPFVVINHYRNDVEVRDVLTDAITKLSSHTLQPFFGSLEEAKEAAMRDREQFVVKRVVSCRGDSTKRSLMHFTLEFEDGDIRELPWSHDLECEAFDIFCSGHNYLKHLTMDTTIASNWMTQMNRRDISAVKPGDTVWIDLRFFGDIWYESLLLPNWSTTSYVTQFEYVRWYHKSSRRMITIVFTLGGQNYTFNTYKVFAWGSNHRIPMGSVVADEAFVRKFPQVLSTE